MSTPLEDKSTLENIRKRFDNDVDRFSSLETGQAATIDAPLALELITQAAISCTANIRRVLDIGCGAGNNTLKLLQSVSPFDCDLIDLSQPKKEKPEGSGLHIARVLSRYSVSVKSVDLTLYAPRSSGRINCRIGHHG